MIKKFFNKKRNIGLLTLALLVGIGVYTADTINNIPDHDGDVLVDSANIENEVESNKDSNENKDTNQKIAVINSDDPVDDYQSNDLKELRATINLDRNKVIDTLNETINSSENEKEMESAKAQRDKILGYIEQETEIENIIKTKSLPESMVLITDKSVNVTVDKQELDQIIATKVCDIVMRQTGRPASEVIVQSIY